MTKSRSFDALLAEEQRSDPAFRAEWQRLAPARAFAAALLRFRIDHGLSQRGLARRLRISQPRVAKLESGDHNPTVETIIKVAKALEIEFALDVAPVGRRPSLVTARARSGAVEHEDVSVVAASSA